MSIAKSIIIPPYWKNFRYGLMLIILGAADYCWQIAQLGQKAARMDAITTFGFLLFIPACIHYSIHEKGLAVRFVWIPIWFISWQRVSAFQYVTRWNTGAYKWEDRRGKYNVKGHIFVVTMGRCPLFIPDRDDLFRFRLKHPLSVIFIRFGPKRNDQYIAMVKRYYPDLSCELGSQ